MADETPSQQSATPNDDVSVLTYLLQHVHGLSPSSLTAVDTPE